ncbi:S41 family peptidase [Carboxylicivirga linearis]|uniref:S41 family peptidase n=1 Tax=Carboxylicivirga linearis TaxID=1628157 RepID=A0ABS5JRF0_9BACT|nr:S41 family peptidase [Carboxylicivirga linearis]MBS2097483.1 S41 family peptidase [Carboxylicivirga linearis]
MKLFLTFSFVFHFSLLLAQDPNWQWPIVGQKAGENILFQPEDYIRQEKNYENIFIGAPEGTPIIAPVDGTIIRYFYRYSNSLTNSMSFHHGGPDGDSLKEFDKRLRKELSSKGNYLEQYISLTIGVSCGKGLNYWISGVRPYKWLKTGELVQKGDTIGMVGYGYKEIYEPHILFSVSLNGKADDPMKPFGIRSSFKPYKPEPLKSELSVVELLEDYTVFQESLEEGHPGLYDYNSKEKMDLIFAQIRKKIDHPMSSGDFKELIQPVVDSIRDSHSFLFSSEKVKKEPFKGRIDLPIYFGICENRAIVYRAALEYKDLLGKEIVMINNDSISEILQKVPTPAGSFKIEGYGQSKFDWMKLVYYSIKYYNDYANYQEGDSITISFSDSTNIKLDCAFRSKEYIKTMENILPWTDKSKMRNLSVSEVDSNTVYFRVNSFVLDQVGHDSLRIKMNEICKANYKNLIIDVRDNWGGNNSYNLLYSMLANNPYKIQYGSMVKSNSEFNFLKHVQSYMGIDTIHLFPDYKRIEGKEGYYHLNNRVSMPHDSIHFTGDVYVLANENSYSAATLFPALVHKYKRGTIIGRETGSCYYQMNAYKSATIRLKNTRLDLKIPLVKIIFDDEINSTIPWGSGVLPDYQINWTYDEAYNQSDPIMDFTLKLIMQKEDMNVNHDNWKSNIITIAIIGFILIGGFLFYIKTKLFS